MFSQGYLRGSWIHICHPNISFPTVFFPCMNTNHGQDHIGEYLLPYFEHKRYMPHRGAGEFRRKTSFGRSAVYYNAVTSDTGTFVDFHLGLRHDLVELRLSSLFGQREYYRADSCTLLVDTRKLRRVPNDGRTVLRAEITSLAHLRSVCDEFIDFMDRTGFPFLEKYSSLAAVDRLYNDLPQTSSAWCNNSYQRCFRGMTIAEILRRENMEELRERHRAYLLSRGYAGRIIEKFDTNFARSGKISLN